MTNKMQRYYVEAKVEFEVTPGPMNQLPSEYWLRLLRGSPQINRPESNLRANIQIGSGSDVQIN